MLCNKPDTPKTFVLIHYIILYSLFSILLSTILYAGIYLSGFSTGTIGSIQLELELDLPSFY